MIHILNGDALLQRFPELITGERIVARECLVDGDLAGNTFDEFMVIRAKFIDNYPQCSKQQYLSESKPEFAKIKKLPENSDVVLWFELDLFCQANMWYVLHLLQSVGVSSIRWAHPNKGNEYNFAGMADDDLLQALSHAKLLSNEDVNFFNCCWHAFKQRDVNELTQLRDCIPTNIKSVIAAIDAELARQPDEHGLGYPERELLNIMHQVAEKHALSFAVVFKAYYQKMAVYSFGDLQVHRMYQQLKHQYFPSVK
ncbi:DUF1835 domain-containing protein [Thalassotalea sediminis]|uniref:DUF1835 domain-containing protein n=1 Tax=Thalassotalea sediminis TaxID=1759089 RepID=UPI0025746FE9|nr:hypothetical protein [Thalassotalea sediminis]